MRNYYERKNEEDMKVLKDLLKDVIKIKYYGYRKAFVQNVLYCFDNFEKYPKLKRIEQRLFKETGKKRKNHESFLLELKKGGRFYIMITDSFMVVGLSINERSF